MLSFLTRPKLIGGAVAAVAVLGLGGVTLASHNTSSSGTASAPSPSAIASLPAAQNPQGKHAHGKVAHELIAKVVSVTGSAITVVDAQGQTQTFTLSPKAKVVGATGQPETASQLPAGEIVVVSYGGGKHAAAGASPSAAPDQQVALSIRDTGFKAA